MLNPLLLGLLVALPSQFGPLDITPSSKIVVVEFEPWFGPDAITFSTNGNIVRPVARDIYGNNLLSSAAMDGVGGGYASDDPAVIREQARLIQQRVATWRAQLASARGRARHSRFSTRKTWNGLRAG